jgi:hypothetical protein
LGKRVGLNNNSIKRNAKIPFQIPLKGKMEGVEMGATNQSASRK